MSAAWFRTTLGGQMCETAILPEGAAVIHTDTEKRVSDLDNTVGLLMTSRRMGLGGCSEIVPSLLE